MNFLMIPLVIFKKRFISLKGKAAEDSEREGRRREKERERDTSSIPCNFLNGHSRWGWARLKS